MPFVIARRFVPCRVRPPLQRSFCPRELDMNHDRSRIPQLIIVTLGVIVAGNPLSAAADVTLSDVQSKYQVGQYADAVKLATTMIEAGNGPLEVYRLRAACYESQRLLEKAIADLDQCIKMRSEMSALYQSRGELHFKMGNITASLADFDHFLKQNPQQDPYHWQRGISYYYAGRYAEGAAQFDRHKRVNPQDVENAVWHYLCKAQVDGVAAAREALIEIARDNRPWAMKVYELFQGKATPQQVLQSAEETSGTKAVRDDSLFYAHLYVGLYYESLKQEELALQHITTAVQKYPSGHYMGDVARVHLQLRKKNVR